MTMNSLNWILITTCVVTSVTFFEGFPNQEIAEMSIERDNVDIMSTFSNQVRKC